MRTNLKEFVGEVKENLSCTDICKVLEIEKQRRNAFGQDLVFVKMANAANFYWCAMKSLINSVKMEMGLLQKLGRV